MDKAKVLYWVNGYVPSVEDRKASRELDADVHFRNAYHVPLEGALEKCDGCAGAVPKRYKDAYPTAEEAIVKFAKSREEVEQIVGDEKAPETIEPTLQQIGNDIKPAEMTEQKSSEIPKWGSQT